MENSIFKREFHKRVYLFLPSTSRSPLLKLTGVILSVLLLSGTGFLPYVDAQIKYLTYENKQYGFSLKYPSDLKKTETLTKSDEPFPNSISLVSFTTPSEITSIGVTLIKDDAIFKGLSGQKFLDKMKNKFKSGACSAVSDPTITCSMEVLYEQQVQSTNGYVGYISTYAFTVSNNQDSQKIAILVVMYPDGNNVWLLGANISNDEDYKGIGDEISKIVDSLKINNYQGSASQSSTIVKSSVGLLQINSGNFAVSKYKPAELIVSGQINNPLQGVPLTLKIIKPDKTTTEQNILVTKDGKFKTPVKLDENWPAGSYRIIAKYGSADLGEVSFQVNTGDAKATTTQQQTKQQTTSQSKKYLTYENKKYGISLKYPSDWQKEETLEKDKTHPEIMNIVEFQSPSGEATFNVGIIQDDKGTSQKISDEMKSSNKDELCSGVPAEANCSVEITEKRLTHKNGYDMRVTTLLFKMLYLNEPVEAPATLTIIPDGKNTWLIGSSAFSPTNSKQLSKEVSSISESFKILNYKGSTQSSIITEQSTSTSSTQKQFSLNVKAIQENDLVTITITSPKDSSSDVYGIKLTTTTGKIKNYVKVNGWDHKRINDNTVSYQTKSSPLEKSDVITIKLKVDAKKPEIKWEAFSKDQKSLGTGKMKP